jgi:hypothetical protein
MLRCSVIKPEPHVEPAHAPAASIIGEHILVTERVAQYTAPRRTLSLPTSQQQALQVAVRLGFRSASDSARVKGLLSHCMYTRYQGCMHGSMDGWTYRMNNLMLGLNAAERAVQHTPLIVKQRSTDKSTTDTSLLTSPRSTSDIVPLKAAALAAAVHTSTM